MVTHVTFYSHSIFPARTCSFTYMLTQNALQELISEVSGVERVYPVPPPMINAITMRIPVVFTFILNTNICPSINESFVVNLGI